MSRIRQDLRIILQSEDFQNDVVKRQALMGNMEKPDTHLLDEVIRLGAELTDVVFNDE